LKIALIAIGRLKSGPERELAERYLERARAAGKTAGLTGFTCVEIPESRARQAETRMREEGVLLLQKSEASRRIVFDERFPSPTSAVFAETLRQWRDSGVSAATCILGGADGLSTDVRAATDWGVSFGRLSLPHQLARVLVAEQLYRALTQLIGHPYHRTGTEE
jgi:23S rRNA (pseudouridine1915-N3)-methyltransferase